ncbi:MAG: hypothetical protein L3K17_10135 [Thermoplasmata archaeon]|nr:hypothetical protein [Thermoplasmata archaeon]
MALKRVGLELSVERELSGAVDRSPGRARLTARFEVEGGPPTQEEVAQALSDISKELDLAVEALGPGSTRTSRGERPLSELVETYRPRQAELVELLADEGEITRAEAELLRDHLERLPSPTLPIPASERPGREEVPITDRPLAAMPLANDRTPTVARPVDHLIREYRIESLKQAGAVRARRQISYEEYMALKRHFAEPEVAADRPAVPSS